ncbi:N-acetylmuramoyl-L-alanine amidase [Beggiatoa alba]|nr:N-acetylmuramoyl-L-alanine amidase [Beggiatoa alba]
MMWYLTKFRVFLLVFLCVIATHVRAESVQLQSMQVATDTATSVRLLFDFSSPVRYRIFSLSNPERLVIDLENTKLSTSLVNFAKNHPLIQNIRSAPRNNNDLRIVLDLHAPVRTKSFLLKPAGIIGHRLNIDILSGQTTQITQAPPATQRSLAQMASTSSPRNPLVISLPPPSTNSTLANQSLNQTAPNNRLNAQATIPTNRPRQLTPVIPKKDGNGRELIVAIDAGHGGIDPGAIGKQGTYEKTVVLAIARQLASLLEREYGMRPVLIRDGDYFLKLRERIDLARQHQADLFISIHADAVAEGNGNVRGSSVYMLSQRGASSEAALWLAEKENAADLLGGVSLNDKDDLLASVLLDLSQTGTLEASAHAAEQILNGLRQVNKTHLSKVQRAGFLVLRSPDIPSVLVETAFISNLEEERKLNDPVYQRQLAQAILQGIRGYFAKYAPPGTQLAQR